MDAKENPVAWWPADRSNVYVLNREDERSYSLACETGVKICYGAQTRNGKKLEWGTGLDGKGGCKDCCRTCGETKAEIRLTCQ